MTRLFSEVGLVDPVMLSLLPRQRLTIEAALRCNDGSVAAEFAVVLTPLAGLLFAALQVALIFMVQDILDRSAEFAARQVFTGTTQTQGLSQDQFRTAICKTAPAPVICNNLMIDVRVVASVSASDAAPPTLTYDQNGQVTNTWLFNPGQPGDFVVIRLVYQWPVVPLPGINLGNLANGMRLLVATQVVRNEKYQ